MRERWIESKEKIDNVSFVDDDGNIRLISDGDTPAIPFFYAVVTDLIYLPFLIFFFWFSLRNYQGITPLFIGDKSRLWRSILLTILFGGIAALLFYWAIFRFIINRVPIYGLFWLGWTYLFLCLRAVLISRPFRLMPVYICVLLMFLIVLYCSTEAKKADEERRQYRRTHNDLGNIHDQPMQQ
ncbi:MAG: hypothetical protein ACOY3I_03810 [Verrucomicrobiota bacterium]